MRDAHSDVRVCVWVNEYILFYFLSLAGCGAGALFTCMRLSREAGGAKPRWETQLSRRHAAPLSKPSDAVLAEKGWVGTEEKEELLGWAAGRKGFRFGVLYSFLAYLRFVKLRSYML